MNSATDPVLEFLEDHDIAVPIGVLDNELDPAYQTIKRALDELEARGFIARDENYTSYFRIMERGRQYLAGDLNASKLDNE
ncbi:phenylalanine--tRNA ligase subunit alpha [Halorussus salinus]|uniref:ArsR family transcriptional regulator n=1 Tax=Halorussus salinus TaxID=1364935 RepID=UPI001092F8FA|nr:ArsR family transcriptional regulator [Halorussus salinus]